MTSDLYNLNIQNIIQSNIYCAGIHIHHLCMILLVFINYPDIVLKYLKSSRLKNKKEAQK